MKNLNTSLLFLFLLLFVSVQGQSLERKVFASGGGDATLGIWHYDYTFGEPIIGTVFSTSPIITMGFQQPMLITPLQADLLTFSANLQEKDGVLQWELRDPMWPGIFTVERAQDGQTFFPIGEVDGLHRGTEGYGFRDKSVTHHFERQVYYRLQLSGPDGRISHSRIVVLTWDLEDGGELRLFPNPATDWLTVQLTGAKEREKTRLRLTDLAGHTLMQLTFPGNEYALKLVQLPAGTYVIEIETAGKAERRKFVKQ